ncbi:hypothetical protein V5O48_011817 [Marasmius crinis-equi]|uniref:F-box domain-containing protein n=1 Tax=Marasmius crinis-equi TaxID=585013 RepID=A0ABR3F4K1_9AGAR
MTCRIPFEMLSRMFYFLIPRLRIDDDDDDVDGSKFEVPTETPSCEAPWFSFSHVCQHWRYIALQTACLWTNIDFSESRLPLELLENRFKGAPLDICIAPRRNFRIEERDYITEELGIYALENYFHRTSSLKINTWVCDGTLSCLDKPAPLLRSLHLGCGAPYDISETALNPVEVPDEFIGGRAPRLKKLVIKDALSTYNFTGLASNLTALHLVMFGHPDSLPPLRPSVREVLGFIVVASNLEKLVLETRRNPEAVSAFCDVPPNDPASQLVHVQNLKVLHLVGSSDCIRFLNYLNFPSSTTVEIETTHIPYAIRNSPDSDFALLSRLFVDNPISSLILEGDGEIIPARDVAHYDEMSLVDVLTTSKKSPRLSLILGDITNHNLTERLYKALPLARLRALHLPDMKSAPSPSDSGYDLYERCFGSLPALHTVSVLGSRAAYNLMPSLRKTAANGPGANGLEMSNALLFSTLRVLQLKDCEETWKESEQTGYRLLGQVQPEESKPNFLEQALSALETRLKCGCGIERVDLIDCGVSAAGIGQIREFIADVRVYSSNNWRV